MLLAVIRCTFHLSFDETNFANLDLRKTSIAKMLSLISFGASSLVVPSRAGTVSMAFPDNSWRKTYDGKGDPPVGPPVNQAPTAFSLGGGGGGAAPVARAAAPAAATGAVTVVQAMKFMQDPSVSGMTVS